MSDKLMALARRIVKGLDRASATTESPRGRKISMAVAAALFIVTMVLSLEALPSGDRQLQWWAILLTAVVGVPVLIALNAVEYQASGAVLGHRIGLREAMPVAIYARAANLLPIPGSALVRMQALKRAGSTYGKASLATLATALMWLGGSLLVGTVVLVPIRPWFALAFLAATIVVCLAGHASVRNVVARREDEVGPREALRLSAYLLTVEVVMVVVRGVRFWLVMVGFDIGGSFAGGMMLPIAGVLSSAIGFFPSGLGVREVISGALARLVGDTAASGALASGIDRLISLPVMAVIALGVGWLDRGVETPGIEPMIDDPPGPAVGVDTDPEVERA